MGLGRLHGRNQMAGALLADANGLGQRVSTGCVGFGTKSRELVHHHIGPCRAHQRSQARRIKYVAYNRLGTLRLQGGRALGASRQRRYLMACGHQQWHQAAPDHAGTASNEDLQGLGGGGHWE